MRALVVEDQAELADDIADGSEVSTEDLLEPVWDENADPFTGSGYRLP
jgi:hypothetical protein